MYKTQIDNFIYFKTYNNVILIYSSIDKNVYNVLM